MKAIRIHQFGGPEVMNLHEVPSLVPASDEILIQIKAIGVNPVDTYIRAGWYGEKQFPYTPGIDAAGIVVDFGQNIRHVTKAQRVFISGSRTGAYAEYALCSQEQLYPLPDSVSFQQGAAVGIPYHTAYRALFQKACSAKGQTLLIHGATGAVGIAALQFARMAGLSVIATAGSPQGCQLLTQQGADCILDHHDPTHLEQAMKFTESRGVDILLEMLANVNLGSDLPILAQNAAVVIIGSRGSVEINPRDLMLKEASIVGLMSALATPDQKKQASEAIGSGLQAGTLNPVIAAEFPLADAARAHQAVMESDHHGKIVLIP